MFRSVASLLTIALIAWFMPLGNFIKPSQEETACGGKRAFHMCSMMAGKIDPHPSSTPSYANASDVSQHGKMAGGQSGDDFLIDSQASLKMDDIALPFSASTPLFRRGFFHGTLDQPPEFSPAV